MRIHAKCRDGSHGGIAIRWAALYCNCASACTSAQLRNLAGFGRCRIGQEGCILVFRSPLPLGFKIPTKFALPYWTGVVDRWNGSFPSRGSPLLGCAATG